MAGIIGKNSQAANQIALNLASMTYMVALGVGVAAMIRVGNQRGMMNFIKLREVALSTLLLIIIIDIFFCIIFLIFNDYLPLLYLDPGDSNNLTDVNEVIEIASKLLIIAGVFQLFDGIQAVVLGALRGMQDVNKPALIIFPFLWFNWFPNFIFSWFLYQTFSSWNMDWVNDRSAFFISFPFS